MAPELPASEALIEFLYRAPIGLLQIHGDGAVTMANPMAAQLLMPLAADADLGNLFDLLAPWAPGLRAEVAAAVAPGDVVCDGRRLAVQAPGRPAQTLSLGVTRFDADTLMCSLSDISHLVRDEQQQLARQLHAAGRTDTLTGLPNREALREHLARGLAATPAQALLVLVVDIDRFDQLNLAQGRAVGDAVLRQVATRLAAAADALAPHGAAVDGGDGRHALAARLGGDEFAFVCTAPAPATAEAACRLARSLIADLARPQADDEGRPLHLDVSVGLRLCLPGDRDGVAADPDALLQDAAIAVREAKRAGGAREALFDAAMKARATHRGLIEAALRQALEHDELHVAYQPIVGLQAAGPGVVGVEALVRWRHPQRGNVPPLDFIEVAEQSGLIGALGAFVLRSACAQFMQWRQALGVQAPQWLSVNLSRAQLADAGLPAQVQAALADSGMPAQALQLEVTESLAAQDAVVRERLQALKALGLRLALDDFGTGYSSLSSLHQLPVDLVKIDRSFVSQLETSAHHRALVKATVDVARSLGMGTVAEGIETPGQAALLQALQCQKGQGWWFGRPMAPDALAQWLRERWAAPAAAPRRRRVRPPRPASAPAGASRSPSGSAA